MMTMTLIQWLLLVIPLGIVLVILNITATTEATIVVNVDLDNQWDQHQSSKSLATKIKSEFDPISSIVPVKFNVSCAAECRCLVLGHWFRMNCPVTDLIVIPDPPSTKAAHLITIIDLSQNSLKHLADYSFARYQHLEELNLASNQLVDLSTNVFDGIIKLRILNVRGNNLTSIPCQTFGDLHSLHELHIGENHIETISAGDFRGLTQLRTLTLEGNRLKVVPVDALEIIRSLEVLSLLNNNISEIVNGSFKNLARLKALNLANNQINMVGQAAFVGLKSLEGLELQHNQLDAIPIAIQNLTSLQKLSVAFNRIQFVNNGIFGNNPELVHADLLGNPITRVEHEVFSNLTRLKILIIPEAKELTEFPDLNGTVSMEFLRIDRARIRNVPPDLCLVSGTLKTLDLKSNFLTKIPPLEECTELRQLQLSGNQIESIEGKIFRNQGLLHDLLLTNNAIEALTSDDFVGLNKLEILNLAGNRIADIHPNAFLPLKHLVYLNVADNLFSMLPSHGLEHVRQLLAFDNPHLRDFPSPSTLPHVHTLRLSYAYHCCQFMTLSAHDSTRSGVPFDLQETVLWLPKDKIDLSLWAGNASDIWPAYQNLTHKFGDLAEDLWGSLSPDYVYPSNFPQVVEDYFEETKPSDYGRTGQSISCSPLPGPFMPCEDLFDWWTLRCGVWIVFLLAMLGNGTVVFVLIFSRTKMDVPRFLVCNLAMADFFMGIYLGFLALVDASTLGQFKRHALQWQFSATCQLAGFLGVLSSELSVFTLAVITLERNYAITHAMHLNKRLSLKHASYVMSVGWIFGIIMAALPLAGVSDYRTFAVCLPFNIEAPWSLAYVVFLMSINGVAFLILMGCYLKMYCAIRGSQAWNSNDSRIAKRMALLVFTDFICWAPIAFFALTAAFGLKLVSLEEAKVFTIFVLPLNSCANPFLYAILTKQFKKDCVLICKAIEESRVTRGIGRCRHSSNFSNRQTPGNTNSAVNSNNGPVACSCSRNSSSDGVIVVTAANANPIGAVTVLPTNARSIIVGSRHQNLHRLSTNFKPTTIRSQHESLNRTNNWWRFIFWCADDMNESEHVSTGNDYAHAIAEIQKIQQNRKHSRNLSVSSSENFSSSRSDSWRQKSSSGVGVAGSGVGGERGISNIGCPSGGSSHHGLPMRLLTDKTRRNSWTMTRKPSQDSNLSSSRNDSSATTPSTSTWRVSRSSVSSDVSSGQAHSTSTTGQVRPSTTRATGSHTTAATVDENNGAVPGIVSCPTVRFNLSTNRNCCNPEAVGVQMTSARPRAKLRRQSAIVIDDDPTIIASSLSTQQRHPPLIDDKFTDCDYIQLQQTSDHLDVKLPGHQLRQFKMPSMSQSQCYDQSRKQSRELFLPRKLSTISSNSCSLNQDTWSVHVLGSGSGSVSGIAGPSRSTLKTTSDKNSSIIINDDCNRIIKRPTSMNDVAEVDQLLQSASVLIDSERRTMSDTVFILNSISASAFRDLENATDSDCRRIRISQSECGLNTIVKDEDF